jgi:Family of unknown function (DUF5681)
MTKRDEKAASDNTEEKQSGLTPWQPGQSGNPSGRPKGARSKLSEGFLNALQADFEQHGPDVIAKVRAEKPDVYLKVVANLMPAKLEALLEAKVDVNCGFDAANSVAEVLELVAKEAGHEAARMLAEIFGVEVHDFGDGMTLLPPAEICPFDPVTNRANYRNWYRRKHNRFPDE